MTVILFDGVCNLCSGFVRFVIARDPHARFKFASLQSAAASRLLARFPDARSTLDTVILVEGDRLYRRSDAALRVAWGLAFPWWLAGIFIVLPRPIRDWLYDIVTRNRYRWFGKQDVCMVPTPDVRARFVEYE